MSSKTEAIVTSIVNDLTMISAILALVVTVVVMSHEAQKQRYTAITSKG
jgi:hypothetical protein